MMNSEQIRIGVAGCGEMGLPMANRLQQAEFDVVGFDIRDLAEFPDFRCHMTADSAAMKSVDVLISVVRDKQQTLDLCFDQQGVFTGSAYPAVLVVSSTLSPRFIRELGTFLPADVILIDAPMSGASHAAEKGTLSFMLGGDESTISALDPMFKAMAKACFYAGESGAGMTLKVLNNYVAATSVASVRRVLSVAPQLNVDPEQLLSVMAASSGSTWFGDQFAEIIWSSNGYSPNNTIGIIEKDVNAALDAINALDSDHGSPLDLAVLDALRLLVPR